MAHVRLVLRVDAATARRLGALALLAAAPVELASENRVLVTAYPSPSGIYSRIITTGKDANGRYDTVLNRQSGHVFIAPNETTQNPGGGVVIGGAVPDLASFSTFKLLVKGNVRATGFAKIGGTYFGAGIPWGFEGNDKDLIARTYGGDFWIGAGPGLANWARVGPTGISNSAPGMTIYPTDATGGLDVKGYLKFCKRETWSGAGHADGVCPGSDMSNVYVENFMTPTGTPIPANAGMMCCPLIP